MNDLQTCTEKQVMTVKEIAEAIGVSYDTVNNCVKRVFPEIVKNGKTTFLNEMQVAVISKELKSNTQVLNQLTFEAGSKVQNTTTRLEVLANYKAATDAFLKMLEAEKAELQAEKAELQAENEAQKQQLAIAEPKAKWYDDFADCTGLIEIGVVGKHLEPYGLGALKIFDRLKADGIIYEKITDGVKSYFAYFRYKQYFALRNGKYVKPDGKKIAYSKLMCTKTGAQWLESKYSRNEKKQGF